MSILDDAIREHLELKRAHGADEAELKKLEDEAFGPPQRPEEGDSFEEAPTEFLREPNIADLQEPPPPGQPAPEAVESEGPAVEEQTAMEHQAVPEAPAEPEQPPEAEAPAEPQQPVADPGPNTEERHALADQPTQFFDVEAEMGTAEGGAPQEAPPPAAASQPEAPPEPEVSPEPEAPPQSEARPEPEAPPQPEPTPTPEPALEDEEDEEFWGEQRLSDELDRALDAPLAEDEKAEQDEELEGSEGGEKSGDDGEPQAEGENVYDPDTGQEDVLEATPEFLEDAPEDDELWFEQRPPKDFDFDD